MKELFIRESGDGKVKMASVITLIVALLFLLVFFGCSPAEKTGERQPAAATQSREIK